MIDLLNREQTLADRMLKGHEQDFTIPFLGKTIPLWKAVEWLAFITNKDDDVVNFRYNYQQCLLYLKMAEMKRSGRQVRINILKARQIGFSTMIAVQSCIYALFTPNVKVGILADTREHASNLFEKIRFVYDHLDENNPYRYVEAVGKDGSPRLKRLDDVPEGKSLAPTLLYCQGKSMLQTAANSSVKVMAIGDNAGRSDHFTILHCSECAFWPSMEKTFISLFQTISRTNPNSMVFLETTANGYNDYKIRWDNDVSSSGGGSSFEAFFAPWWGNPDYSIKPLPYEDVGSLLEPWERQKQEKHHLSDAQMKWFHEGYCDLQRDKQAMLQENPFDPSDAFATTGSSVFDVGAIGLRKAEIYELDRRKGAYEDGWFSYSKAYSEDGSIIRFDDKSIAWYASPDGPIRIFERPLPGEPYVITCDPNMGGRDDIAMQVMDNRTCRQVARFKSNRIPNDEAAYLLYCLGRYYNDALVSSETNVGQIVMDILIKSRYPKIYVEQEPQTSNYTKKAKTRYGHRVQSSNRQLMLDELKRAFREDPAMIRDYDTLCEMEAFQLVEHVDRYTGNVSRAKQEASGGAHDDLVMALAAFFLVRDQQTTLREILPRPSRLDGFNAPESVGWRLMVERQKGKEAEEGRRVEYVRRIGIAW